MKRLQDAWSNVVRFEQLQGCLTESPALEMERLSAIYLQTPAAAEKRELTGRQRILSVMRDGFEKVGVLALMQKDTAVAEFTRPGDPLQLDFGYPMAGAYKFLHAVSLAQRVDAGMILAARFPQIAAGMQEKRGVKAWLTAVVDDDLRRQEEVTFTLEMMQESGIVVARTAEIANIAEGIRAELNLSP